ncbi:hypothetical protein BKI52_36900 [marine bacterium AO1-C]|nr:hypothetical protein BKI52_36900 [marine bacterium AO1-C]
MKNLCLFVVFFSISIPLLAANKIKAIDIFVIDKRIVFSVATREKNLKRPGSCTQYTLNQPANFKPFERMLQLVPTTIKRKKRRGMIGEYIITEIFFEDGTSVAFGMDRRFKVEYNSYDVAIDGHQFHKTCLQPFISPALNWHSFNVKELDLEPRRVHSKYLNYKGGFDGYVVQFTAETKRFIAEKAVRKRYFTSKEYSQAFDFLNGSILIGIDLKTKEIVSIHFAEQEEKHLAQGEMSNQLFEKYKRVIRGNIQIQAFYNVYNLKSDIIYKMIEFKD